MLRIIGRALSLLKQIAVASFFGAGSATDAYFVAAAIPDSLVQMLGLSIFRTASTSLLARLAANTDKNEFDRVFSTIINLVLVVSAFFTLLCFFTMPVIIRLLAPGFDPATHSMAVSIGRVIIPVLFLMGVSYYLFSVLNAVHRFVSPALSIVMINIAMISAIFLFHHRLGIMSLAYGFLAGWLLVLLIQIPPLVAQGVRYHPFRGWNTALVRKVWLLIAPLFVMTILAQLHALQMRFLISFLPSGQVSAFSYALLSIMSVTLFLSEPFLIAFLPRLAQLDAMGKGADFTQQTNTAARMLTYILLPISLFLIVFARETVSVLFRRGNFDEMAVAATSLAFIGFAIGIVPQALYLLFQRVFFARNETKIVARIDIIALVAMILVNFIVVKPFGIMGIAIVNSAGMFLRDWLYWKALKKRVDGIASSALSQGLVRMLLPATASVLIMIAIKFGFDRYIGSISFVWLASELMAGFIAAAAVYLAVSFAVGISEPRDAGRLFKGIVARKKA